MPHEQVKAVIDKKTGKLTIEGVGFVGDSCDVLKDVEQHLGQITQTKEKDERYNYVQPDYLPNAIAG